MTPTIVADTDTIRALATQLQLTANYAATVAGAVHHGLGLGDLSVAATLDPAGAARFETAALRVITGPFGLAGIETEINRVGQRLIHAAGDYADAERHLAGDLLHFVADLPATDYRVGVKLLQRDPIGAGQALLTGDPAIVDAAAAFVRPAVELTGGLPLVDGSPVVRRIGPVQPPRPVPRNLDDLQANLAELNDHRRSGQGEIDIQTITGTDAAGRPTRQIVAYLPGTDTFTSPPGSDVNDLTTNINAVAGQPTSYENGVLAALRAAGVTSTDDVTLVGHSQGGVIAVNAARDAFDRGEFNVSHVLTFGSPTGVAARTLPASTRLLAVENKHDIVPGTDATANPRRPNITTVAVDNDTHGIGSNHELEQGYQGVGRQLDDSPAPAVRDFRRSEYGGFHPDQASTVRYSITRSGLTLLPH